jgi:hypothetical protein
LAPLFKAGFSSASVPFYRCRALRTSAILRAEHGIPHEALEYLCDYVGASGKKFEALAGKRSPSVVFCTPTLVGYDKPIGVPMQILPEAVVLVIRLYALHVR